MYQIPYSGINLETKERLTIIQHKIDDLMTESKSDEFSSVKYFRTPDDEAVTVMRDFGEYSIMTDGVFVAPDNLLARATTSLAFNNNFDVVEAGIRLHNTNGNEVAFMGTAPAHMLGFVAMIDAQFESVLDQLPKTA